MQKKNAEKEKTSAFKTPVQTQRPISVEMEVAVRTTKEEFLSVYLRLKVVEETLWHSPGTLVKKGANPYYQYYIQGQQIQQKMEGATEEDILEMIASLKDVKETRKGLRTDLQKLKKALKALGVRWEQVIEDYGEKKREKDAATAVKEAARKEAAEKKYPKNYRHYTDKGVFVASKSEQTICNELHKYGVNFEYEKYLNLPGCRLRPDFTVTRRDGSVVYWEHLGMMENPKYKADFFEREKIYKKNGIEAHKNLIITQDENQAIDVEYVRRVIRDYRLI